jgi:hypothetical protein
MWSDSRSASRAPQPQRQLAHRPKRGANRRREARRLFLEGLEDRRLMAFNVLADYATGTVPVDLALEQIDPGSHADLVVVNSVDSTVSVRLGNGDGTFGDAQVSATGTNPRAVAAGRRSITHSSSRPDRELRPITK